ncbi:MAG: hypothetical protein JWO19_4575 [Bryobacterales bacterium]|jgi:hypothetical protein|nr:hypothetical protein [Bryobacterales bacterium]
MLKRALLAAAVIVSTAAVVWAADPVVGTWKLNVAKSKFSPGPAPQEETRTYEARGDGIRVTVRTIAANGHSTTVNIAANYDGKDYPVTGSSDYDAIALKRTSDRTAEGMLLHAGKLVATSTREVSPDGQVLTITYKTSDNQDPINNRAVYDKQ